MYKYIYEFKIAVGVTDDVSIEDGLNLAAQNCEILYGFKPSIWFCEISKFDNNGACSKYFYNPNSSTILEIE